jgi:hypothetical protein
MTVTTVSDAHIQWCEDREIERMEAASYAYGSYEESVIDHADDNGCLDLNDACHLLNQHDALLTDYINETGDRSLNAESMLTWLGY